MRAIELALDTIAIAESLPSIRVADLRRDLELCGDGPLVPPIESFRPLQAQAQLVVRAALFRAGVEPYQPMHAGSKKGKKPDILLENGLTTHAIEVKRPTVNKNVVPRAKDASLQLKGAGLTGGVLLDITDCLRDSNPKAAEAEVIRQAELITKEFFIHGEGWRPGCSHVLMVAVIARPAWRFQPTGENARYVYVHSTSCVAQLGTDRGSGLPPL